MRYGESGSFIQEADFEAAGMFTFFSSFSLLLLGFTVQGSGFRVRV